MAWNENTQKILETKVFKGKIIDRRNGRGGLIYIVEQDAHPKLVAYKTIKEFESNISADMTSIERETRNWFKFSGHPLIIKPHFIEEWEGFPLICMPYCDGDLSELVSKKLSLTSVICLSMQIMKAMMTANKRGMDYHQDIKPENILFTDLSKKFAKFPPSHVDLSLKYSIRLADFGVANAWYNNHLGGTNAYKAPEQYEFCSHDGFDPDVFAVGLVISELFQGFHPASIDSKTNISKWRGSKLKIWATSGKRHFKESEEPQDIELVSLLRRMLDSDPLCRPSFEQCYTTLENLLRELSSPSLTQLDMIFEYFEYIDSYCQQGEEVNKQLKLANVSGQRYLAKENVSEKLKNILDENVHSLENILWLHHLSPAFEQICGHDKTEKDTELLIRSSTIIINFVLEFHEKITAEYLFPSFSPPGIKRVKICSDLEAKTEVLGSSIARLEVLNSYSDDLKRRITESGNVIEACILMNKASIFWSKGHRDDACLLLEKVINLAPQEPELVTLYDIWVKGRDVMKSISLI